jgi:hypothetical protein
MKLLAIALAVLILSAVGASTASAAGVHGCSQRYAVRDRLQAVATITSVRNTSCRSALGVVRRNGREAKSGRRHFRLGKFHCTRYFHLEESNRARCTTPRRAFRVDYGS